MTVTSLPSADSLERLNDVLASIDALPDRVIEIARHVPGRLAFSTSLGLEDQAITQAIAASGVAVDLFTLDTGRHFPETLETLDETARRYNLRIRVLAPDARDVEDLVARDGVMGFRVEVERRLACCDVRKVRPLARGLAGASGWLTGLRRGQSAGRTEVAFAAVDKTHGLVKLNPIADWALARLEDYIASNEIPVNPLHGRGYPSIGCAPCTRAILPGEDIRAGRWWWENELGKECGLHSRKTPATTEQRA